MADAVEGSERPLTPEARLDLGRALEERQDHGRALLAYYRAIIEAQRAGPLARRRDDGAGTPRPRDPCHALREGRSSPRLRRGARARLRPPWPRGAGALRCLPRDPGRRAPRAVRGLAAEAVDALLPGPARRALVFAATAFPGSSRWSARRRRSARSCSRSCRARTTASASSAPTKPSGAGSPRPPARRPGTGSTSGATASGATPTTRSARARRRRSRRCRSCASAAMRRR